VWSGTGGEGKIGANGKGQTANRVMTPHFWGNEMLCHSLGFAGREMWFLNLKLQFAENCANINKRQRLPGSLIEIACVVKIRKCLIILQNL
jgi:hypothetical protein